MKNTATSTAHVGYDAGKRIKGRKRFFLVDLQGNLLAAWVTSAAVHDGTAAVAEWEHLTLHHELLDEIQTLYVDNTFRAGMQRALGKRAITVLTPSEVAVSKGPFCIHAKRWVVERTIAWANNCRRLAKDYERKVQNAAAWIYIANIRRLLRLT